MFPKTLPNLPWRSPYLWYWCIPVAGMMRQLPIVDSCSCVSSWSGVMAPSWRQLELVHGPVVDGVARVTCGGGHVTRWHVSLPHVYPRIIEWGHGCRPGRINIIVCSNNSKQVFIISLLFRVRFLPGMTLLSIRSRAGVTGPVRVLDHDPVVAGGHGHASHGQLTSSDILATSGSARILDQRVSDVYGARLRGEWVVQIVQSHRRIWGCGGRVLPLKCGLIAWTCKSCKYS